ncbi:MAG: tRNA lysidine(34) synthetase TilS C-terminal domain-containing protein, partial [Chitinophagia bacterium]
SPLDTILHALFSRYGFSAQQIPELKKLMDASTGKFILSDTHRVLKNREWFLVDKIENNDHGLIILDDFNTENIFTEGKILIDLNFLGNVDPDPSIACIDRTKLKLPLILRPIKAGDYFYPLGMKKKKKLFRFMTDLKLSRIEKEKQWVLESDKKIVWVVGRRIDDRFKLSSSAESFIKMSFLPNT